MIAELLSFAIVGINPSLFGVAWNDVIQQRLLDSKASLIRIERINQIKEDQAVKWAKDNNVKVLYMCGYSDGIVNITQSSAARQEYADRCLADVERMDSGNTITYVEVWNEWNGGIGLPCKFGDSPCNDGALYTDLLTKVYDTIKSIRPNIKIVGGGVAGRDLDFIGRMLDNGAHAKMDFLSWHFYVKPSTSCSNSLTALAADVVKKFNSCVKSVKDLFITRGLTPKKQLFSEWGRFDDGSISRQQLAAETIEVMHTSAEQNSDIEGLIWYDLQGAGVASNEGFGLYNRQGVAKPQFFAFRDSLISSPRNLRVLIQ